MEKKKKISKKKITRLFILIVGLIVVIVGAWFLITKVIAPGKTATKVKVVDNINSYGYTLDENETKYYKSLFTNLKKELNEKTVDEKKYATLVSQLFLSDFFNLDNKISKNDVGGLQFVYSDFQADFQKLAKESVYQYVENNTYGDRNQELPKVASVEIISIEEGNYEYLETSDEKAYTVEAKITYEEDMGYQQSATLTLVHNKNKLEVAKMVK